MSRSVCQRKIIRELARDHQVEHLDDVLLGIKCVPLVDTNIDGFSSAKLYQHIHTSGENTLASAWFFLRILGWNWGK